MVFAGIFPVDTDEYEELRDAMEKLQVERCFASPSSPRKRRGPRLRLPLRLPRHAAHGDHPGAVGARVRHDGDHHRAQRELLCLHQERRQGCWCTTRASCPTQDASTMSRSPTSSCADHHQVRSTSAIMNLCHREARHPQESELSHQDRVELTFDMPLGEIVFDFYDKLKTISRGYASSTITRSDYRQATWSSSTSCSTAIRWMPSRPDPPRQCAEPRQEDVRQAQGTHAAPAVRHRHPGRHRCQDHQPAKP
jgi:GTP-binding protein LepA